MNRFLLPLLASAAAICAAAQSSAVETDLQVAGRKFRSNAPGECKSAAEAAIYGVRAAMTMISQRQGDQSLRLALWQPRDGSPPMLQLEISSGAARQSVDTMRGGTRKDTKGTAKASMARTGAGGTVTVDATTATGERITGTVRCAAFGGVQAEGG